MRFVTEFESNDEKYVDGIRKIHKEENLGHEIADKFGWGKAGFITAEGLAAIRYSIEIQAFPMGKWVEFKMKILNLIDNPEEGSSSTRLEHIIKELESYGTKEEPL